MRIVSWNIAFGEPVRQAIDELQSSPVLQGADIVLLQEMDPPGTEQIATALGADYAYTAAAAHRRTGRDFGNAIVSRWPMRAVMEIPLPYRAPIGGQPRSATRATVTVGDLDVVTYSVHTEVPSLALRLRIAQFDRVATDAAARTEPAAIVGGDFNTVTGRGAAAAARSMYRAGLQPMSDASAATFVRAGRPMTLDHLFARGLQLVDHGVATDATASDHRPIWVELAPDGSEA